MAKRKPRNPFDVSLNDEQKKTLCLWLVDELQNGLNAKATTETDVEYWHRVYEQARTRTGRSPSQRGDRCGRPTSGVSPSASISDS